MIQGGNDLAEMLNDVINLAPSVDIERVVNTGVSKVTLLNSEMQMNSPGSSSPNSRGEELLQQTINGFQENVFPASIPTVEALELPNNVGCDSIDINLRYAETKPIGLSSKLKPHKEEPEEPSN